MYNKVFVRSNTCSLFMETFSRFQEVLFLKENIETHILANSRNDLTFDIFRNDYKSSLSFFQNSSNKKISSNIIGQIHKHHTSFDYYLDTFRAAYGSIKHSFREDTCDIVANFSTKFFNKQLDACKLKISKPSFEQCIFSIGGTIRSVPVSTSFAIGLTHKKAIATLCSFKSNIIQANIVGSVTEDYALLTFTSLHKKGILFCFSADLAQLSVHELQIGFIKNFHLDLSNPLLQLQSQEHQEANNQNNNNQNDQIQQKNENLSPNCGLFVSGNILRKSIEISGKYEFKLGTFGFKSFFSFGDEPNSIEGGLILPRNAKFTIKSNNLGLISMETELKPREWLTVYLRSQTSAVNAFNPVTYGWSLGISL